MRLEEEDILFQPSRYFNIGVGISKGHSEPRALTHAARELEVRASLNPSAGMARMIGYICQCVALFH